MNILRSEVELECSRGMKYWTIHTVCNVSFHLIILAMHWYRLCCLAEFTSWYLCWTSSDLCRGVLACSGALSPFALPCLHNNLQTNTHTWFWMQTQHDNHVFHLQFKTSALHAKDRHYMAPQACGVLWLLEKQIGCSLTWDNFCVLFACKWGRCRTKSSIET